MINRHGHSWYRDEAERIRSRAAAIENDEDLRHCYLSLAREYDRLADTLEGRQPPTEGESSSRESVG